MINSSAPGWIDKFFSERKKILTDSSIDSLEDFYKITRNTGFIYGHVTALSHGEINKSWTVEETAKIALLSVLYDVFCVITKTGDLEDFIYKATLFYREIHPESFSLLKKIFPKTPLNRELEKIIDNRIQTNENIISKNFSHILANTLLFMDVLAFEHFLNYGKTPEKYLKRLEETLINIVSLALKTKNERSVYDNLLIKVFESSVRFTKFSNNAINDLDKIQLDHFKSTLEKNYLLDMAGMAVWNDRIIDANEKAFLYDLAYHLQTNENEVEESIAFFDTFIRKHSKEINFFKYSNPIKHFYDNATQTVILLITRNKKRLIKELSNNGELVVLLTRSTHSNLSAKEKKKIKKQLLEICKTIPSLTIFLLPGGSLLLPILIKFIPKLLPNVFNENLDNE